jgi:coenzyme F420-reducing hydrogenase delta subunit
MPVATGRGNPAGKTALIAAVNATTGADGVVLVSVNIADILAAVGISPAEKRAQAMRRLVDELTLAVTNDARTNAEIDQQIADATARAARERDSRPTGSL